MCLLVEVEPLSSIIHLVISKRPIGENNYVVDLYHGWVDCLSTTINQIFCSVVFINPTNLKKLNQCSPHIFTFFSIAGCDMSHSDDSTTT